MTEMVQRMWQQYAQRLGIDVSHETDISHVKQMCKVANRQNLKKETVANRSRIANPSPSMAISRTPALPNLQSLTIHSKENASQIKMGLARIENEIKMAEEQTAAVENYLSRKQREEKASQEQKRRRVKDRKEIMQGGCLFPNAGTTYRSPLREVTHFVSHDGIVVPVNTTSRNETGDQPDISRSDSAYEDTWRGFGVAHPESDGRFGGVIGEDFSD